MYDDSGRIIKRLYIKADIKLETPIIVGSGDSENADMEVLKDYLGNPFIPASSIAGVFRAYLNELLGDKQDKESIGLLFGKDDGNFTMSCLNIYDGYFKDECKIDIRDGVKLNDRKTAETRSKYDYEIVETGNMFTLRMELIIRKCHEKYEKSFKIMIAQILYGINDGEIFIGAKTNRGFGYISLTDENLSILELDFENDDEASEKWLEFNWNSFNPNMSLQSLCDINEKKEPPLYNKLVADFVLPGSIMIRRYSKDPADIDYEHIKCGGKPIIPGTSWAGAIRQSSLIILEELCGSDKREKLKEEINKFYGDVDEENKTSQASLVKFKESVIINGEKKTRPLVIQRVRVDRFTGGALDKGLYNEKPQYLGETTLEILVKKGHDYITALLILTLKELNAGIAAIGGETSIGRGIMELKNATIDVSEINSSQEEKYFKALVNYLRKGGLLNE